MQVPTDRLPKRWGLVTIWLRIPRPPPSRVAAGGLNDAYARHASGFHDATDTRSFQSRKHYPGRRAGRDTSQRHHNERRVTLEPDQPSGAVRGVPARFEKDGENACGIVEHIHTVRMLLHAPDVQPSLIAVEALKNLKGHHEKIP